MTVGLHHVEMVMGMAVSIDVRDPHVPAGAITEVADWLHHVDATFSPYKDSSPITRFGRDEITRDELSATDFCINAGGDIVVRGEPSPGRPWRIGIRHPDLADKLATVVVGAGPLAIATSATYERGQHIIDPRSGRPATSLASVTVVGPDLTFADAYATAVFVMGIDGVRWLAEHDGYGVFAVTPDGMVHITSIFDQHR
jgi:FAD:protein FMN transferase